MTKRYSCVSLTVNAINKHADRHMIDFLFGFAEPHVNDPLTDVWER